MQENLIAKMICDTQYADGGVYFYETYFQWDPRGYGQSSYSIRIAYADVEDYEVIHTHKKQVKVKTKDGKTHWFFLYHFDAFIRNLRLGIDRVNGGSPAIDAEVVDDKEKTTEDDITKLERLKALHDSGALTDEEFTAAKRKILGL